MTYLRVLLALVSIVLVTACGGGTGSIPRTTIGAPAQSDAMAVQNAVAAPQAAETPLGVSCVGSGECSLNINAGGAAVTGWDKDEDYSGPSYTEATNQPISTAGVSNPAPQAVYQSARVATGDLKYTITYGTAPLGNFSVSLHFAELYFASPGSRVFNVSINGTRVLNKFDVEATAGGKFHAIVETFTGFTTANSIVVQFDGVTNNPIINGLQVKWGIPGAPTYQLLYNFQGGTNDGAYPESGLTQVGNLLYGTTTYGGLQAGDGTVYAISPSYSSIMGIVSSGPEHVVYFFDAIFGEGNDGANPQAGLIGVNGALYGTTFDGGNEAGTVFKVSTSGAESTIVDFSGEAGAGNPAASLVDLNGVLYGTATQGLTYPGAVFSVNSSGQESELYDFKGGADGAFPYGGLIAVNGALYGTTTTGGTSGDGVDGNGTVFEVSTSGAERVVYSFKGGKTDGYQPLAGLIDVNGTLYGTTYLGGASNKGTVFEVTTSGAERVLYSFKGGTDGGYPQAGLIYVNGSLYGTTSGSYNESCSGTADCGTIFEVSTSGTERVLYNFKGGTDGGEPVAGLLDVNGVLYGTTKLGGFGRGTVFALSL